MIRQLRTHLPTLVVAGSVAALVAGGPAVAHGVKHALFAHNADKVDGKHAVGAGASLNARKGKLVATSATTGLLPNSIIAKAPDADKLDDIDSASFVQGGGGAILDTHRRDIGFNNLVTRFLTLPGLGFIDASCSVGQIASLRFSNTSGITLDSIVDDGGTAPSVTTVGVGGTHTVLLMNPDHVTWQITAIEPIQAKIVATVDVSVYNGPTNCRFTGQAAVQDGNTDAHPGE